MLRAPVVETSSRDAADEAPRPWSWLGVAIVAACWAVLRLAMNREYAQASFTALVELRAPLPFGHRVLVPLLVRPFVDAGVTVTWAFGVSEWLATIALVVALMRALGRDLPSRAAALGAVLVLPILALPMLLAHRWNVFYPWDTWAMVAIVLVIDAIRRDRMALACVIVFVGGFNRESIALAPLLAIVLRLHSGTMRTTLAWAVWMVFAYAAARGLVAMTVPARGEPLHVWLGDEFRLAANLRWLSDPGHLAQWLGSIAVLPLLWWSVREHAPRDLVRTHTVVLVAILGLFVVANVYEPRVYGELVVLAWWVGWTGAWRWATGIAIESHDRPPWIAAFDRWAAIAIALVAVAAALSTSGMRRG